MLCEGLLKSRDLRRDIDNILLFSIRLQDKMIILVVADLHSLERIPVVGILQCQYFRSFHISLIYIVLQCHFQSDFHANASGIGKKAVIQIPRKPVSQLCRKLQRRIMSQPSQHDMREFVRLILDSFCDDRMLVTVDRAPPG